MEQNQEKHQETCSKCGLEPVNARPVCDDCIAAAIVARAYRAAISEPVQ